jgi:cytochrome c553
MIFAPSQSVWRLAALLALAAAAISSANVASANEAPTEKAAAEQGAADAAGIEFFEQKIRPVLATHCYKCHAADSKTVQGGLRLDDQHATRTGGDSGPAVVPGKVGDSLLITAIEYGGEFYDMPPDGKLPASVIADFRKWIEMGAPDPRVAKANPATPAAASKAATREDLWVLKPLVRPQLPDAKDPAWATSAVDRFILATLDKHDLAPAAPADRHTLLRRVTYDLTGLPPTPAEIEAFINDTSDLAWQRVVDRLLASSAFGDHWARHWFDLSCYADLADVQGNVVVQGAWRYRDYVISAFNADKPFDRFIAEQLAGDLLPHESVAQRREQLIATGYLSIGPWALQNYVKQQLQADVVDHQVDKVSRTFLGMSVRCARCHDHKFDPIPTRDYYALAGIFNSTLTTRYDGPGVWSQVVSRELPPDAGDQPAAEFAQSLQQLKSQQASLQTELGRLERETSPVKLTEKVVSPSANSLTQAIPIAANKDGQEYQISFAAGPTVWAMSSQATGADDGLVIQVLRKDGSVLAFHEHMPGAWTGASDAQALRPGSFSYRGDGTGPVTLHITASRPHTGRFAGAIDDIHIVQAADSKAIYSENFDRFETRGAPGQQANTRLPVLAGVTFPGWIGNGTNHSHAVDRGGASSQHNIALQIFSGPPATSTNPAAAKIQQTLGDIASRLQLMEYARPSRTHALGKSTAWRIERRRHGTIPNDSARHKRPQGIGPVAHQQRQSGHAARAGQSRLATFVWRGPGSIGRLFRHPRRTAEPS